jgi:hypothetical protein
MQTYIFTKEPSWHSSGSLVTTASLGHSRFQSLPQAIFQYIRARPRRAQCRADVAGVLTYIYKLQLARSKTPKPCGSIIRVRSQGRNCAVRGTLVKLVLCYHSFPQGNVPPASRQASQQPRTPDAALSFLQCTALHYPHVVDMRSSLLRSLHKRNNGSRDPRAAIGAPQQCREFRSTAMQPQAIPTSEYSGC